MNEDPIGLLVAIATIGVLRSDWLIDSYVQQKASAVCRPLYPQPHCTINREHFRGREYLCTQLCIINVSCCVRQKLIV